jgi:hypothetical protein
MLPSIPRPNKTELRNFGLITGTIFAALFGLLLPCLQGNSLPPWPWVVAIILWLLAALAPTILNPIFQVWMRVGLILGWVETHVILGMIFYGIVMPMGIVMRLLNHDSMTRIFETSLSTYRSPSQPKTKASMERPF